MNAVLTDKSAVPAEFDDAAGAYDLLTSLSPGYDYDLRRSAQRLALGAGARVLDLCCGTGRSTAALRATYPDADLVGLDASSGMLEHARKRAGLDATLLLGDATEPAAYGAEGPFDAILMAYGIRNLPNPDRGLANIRAVLKPGGVICFHEYSVADSWWGRVKWAAVCWGVIIPLGWIFGGSTTIYRYLYQSVVQFDGVAAMEERLKRAGFVDVRTEPMGGWQRGVLHSFLARAPR
jgi:ubiquinone/menaquinone biosynthesis C-methylase UbiE